MSGAQTHPTPMKLSQKYLLCIHTEKSSDFLFNQPRSDCIYHFPVDLDPSGITFVQIQSDFGFQQKSEV